MTLKLSKKQTKVAKIAAVVVLVAAVALLYVYRDKVKAKISWWPWGTAPVTESYSNIGDVDNVGSIDDDYEMLQNEPAPADTYADLEEGIEAYEPLDEDTVRRIRPMDRLRQIQGKQLLPRISSEVTPQNVDIADPQSYMYMANTPSVILKDRQRLAADPFRGDIPITYHPDVPVVSRSRYGRDSLRLDGFFSDTMKSVYERHTGGEQVNRPMYVVNGELVMDA